MAVWVHIEVLLTCRLTQKTSRSAIAVQQSLDIVCVCLLERSSVRFNGLWLGKVFECTTEQRRCQGYHFEGISDVLSL